MTVTLTHPVFLQLGIAVVLLVFLGMGVQTRRRKRLAEYLGGPRGAIRTSTPALYGRRVLRTAVVALAAFFAALGAAEPVWDAPPEVAQPTQPPKSIVIAIDISASMQATDVLPTRLGRAVQVAQELVAAAEGSTVGLLVFAGKAYVLMPPTNELEAVEFLLDGMSATIASAQDPGSLLSSAIEEAASLHEQPPTDRAPITVLISDGETAEPVEVLLQAAEESVASGGTLYTIGIGTAAGGTMSLPRNDFQLGGPLLAPSGEPVVSRSNEPLLRRLADLGGGQYVQVDDASGVRRIAATLGTQGSSPLPPAASEIPDLGFALALLALALLLLDGLIEVRERWNSSALLRAEG